MQGLQSLSGLWTIWANCVGCTSRKYEETLGKTSQNLEKSEPPSPEISLSSDWEPAIPSARVNLYLIITGWLLQCLDNHGRQFLQKLNKISRGCKSSKVGLGWSGPIVWDAEDCTLEHTREKLLSQAAAGVAFIFTGRQHKVFFYLSCSAMQPTTWPKTDFINLGPKKPWKLYFFQALISPWSINPTHCVGKYVLDHKRIDSICVLWKGAKTDNSETCFRNLI